MTTSDKSYAEILDKICDARIQEMEDFHEMLGGKTWDEFVEDVLD